MKKLTFNLNNKNIVITGGSGFLGSQITEALLKQKANVYVLDIKKPKKNNAAKFKFIETNITNESELKKILKFFKLKKLRLMS